MSDVLWHSPVVQLTEEEWERERAEYERDQIEAAKSEAAFESNVKEANK
jgi:hypothetical protein